MHPADLIRRTTQILPQVPNGSWWVIVLLLASVCINYIDRGNLSIAAPILGPELSLNTVQIGLLFSAFFVTYSLFQIVSGLLVDRFNVNWVYAAGFLIWSAATFATGLTSTFAALIVLRLLLGAGESVVYPAVSKIVVTNFPEERRGLANALVDAGAKLGPAIGTLAGGLLVANYGWRVLFVALGLGSLVWLIPWCLYARNTVVDKQQKTSYAPGFREILGKLDAWGTSLGLFCYGYVWYFLLTWLPSYLVMERHLSLSAMAWVGSLSYWIIAASTTFCGWASDRWIRRGTSPTLVRKGFVISGLLLCMLVFPAALASSSAVAVSLLLAVCVAIGLFSSNVWALTQTLAGPFAAGRWSGIQNAVGNIGGILSPLVTGWIVSRTGSFLLAFGIAAAMLFCGAASYIFLVGRVEPVTWQIADSD